MAQAVDELVGRAAELGVVDDALERLERNRSGALALVGEPGIGKTRMLAELEARAAAKGQIVLSGNASELESELPFWVFVDALDEYVQALEPSHLDSLDHQTLAELAHILPSLSARSADPPAEQRDDRYRAHSAVCRLLESLAAGKPLVLVLDDLHWADSGSIELLGSLLRRPPSEAVLLALAVRPRQLPERLSAALERAHRDGALTRLEVGALSEEEARELLGAGVDRAEAAALHSETGGNPFYLEQLARAPRPAGAGTPAAGGVSMAGVEVPRAVAAALTEELALLSDPTRRILEGAAVAGDPFEPELAAAAAGSPEAAAMDALDELLQRDLVRETDVPRRFRFRHPLVRRAVYEAAPGGWRLGAHERTADALATRGAPAVERAHHVESSARRGDLVAVAVLREAGQAAAGRTPATAARLFAGALRLLPATAPTAERAALLDALAGAEVAVGRLREPRAAMLESLDLRRAAPPGVRVRLIAAIASIENLLGLHKEAHIRLTTTLEELPDPSSPEAAALLLELAIDGFYRLDLDSMQEFAQRSIEVTAPLDQPSLRATGLALHAVAAVLAGNVPTAEASCAEAAGLIDVMSDDDLARSRRADNNLATAEVYLDRLREAEAHAERALAVAYATGQEQFIPILFWTGFVRTARGRLAEAAEILDTAVEIARLSNHAQGLAWNLGGRSLAATAAGDIEAALAAGEEAAEVLRGQEPSFPAAWASVALATALEPAGDPGRAAEVLLEAAGGDDLPRIPAIWRPAGFELMTRCRLALGEPDGARRAADRAAGCARDLGLPLAAARAGRADAMVALDAGDPLSAVDVALASATTAAASGAVLEAAVSRMLAGRALATAGERKRAAAELEGAAADFDACAASGRRQAAERELGKLGRRVHRRTRPGKADGTGVESLTERELEVARLVVDRKTNAQIASELFLSPKTVETHIRHLFRKLDVSSRVEVARVVERADRQVGAR